MNDMNNTLYIIRGLPGSGKSTLARTIFESEIASSCHREADMYFQLFNNNKFSVDLLGNAHAWCQREIEKAMEINIRKVIVSNTFVKLWEMQPYVEMANRFKYTINYIECRGSFGSIHNVPEKTIEKMRFNWEVIK